MRVVWPERRHVHPEGWIRSPQPACHRERDALTDHA
jgi:hypothetical protein